MPAKKVKVDGYQVRTPEGVTAKHTTEKKAQAQVNLLNAISHGWEPTGKPAKSKRKTGSRSDIDHETSCPGIGKSKMATMHRGEHVCRE